MLSAIYIVIILVSYLLGSIPFGYLLVRIFRGQDIRQTGSGNIGATNVARSGAKGLGILTLVLDALKGLLAVFLASNFAHNLSGGDDLTILHRPREFVPNMMAAAALAAVVGHVFPVWLKFKGGKGVATALGVFILLFPKALMVSLLVFIVCVAVSRYVSLGSILAAASLPVAAYFLEDSAHLHQDVSWTLDWSTFLPACIACLLIIAKHHENIRRLLAGSENRLGGKKTPAEDQA